MTFYIDTAGVFVPDGSPVNRAINRTTHMGIAAHQDDIEIMAYHGILECFGKKDNGFMGVVVTDGGGSPRDGLYVGYTDEMMRAIRREEQKKAAVVGETWRRRSSIFQAPWSRMDRGPRWWMISARSSRPPALE